MLQTSENIMASSFEPPFLRKLPFFMTNSYFHRLQLTVCLFFALLFFLTSMYIHNTILKRKRVFTTLHDVACSFLFMHKKTTASAMVFHLLLSICLSVHFFCCSFLYFLYRYTGMPIMTLRQMMIKTLASNTLLIDAHSCS